MTKPKTGPRVKTGRKKRSEKAYQNEILRLHFYFIHSSAARAASFAKCGYDYARKKYQEFRAEREKWKQYYNLHRNKLD
jgi:hypothetical protein